jgi:lipid II:glycine glycyltransferase (peptidoglycan interpeptide bridge formation enzyme)
MVNYIDKKDAGGALIASSDNETHAALLTVKDAQSAYYLIGASDPKHKSSGAMSLLMWESILAAKQEGCLLFNFEGSIIPSIEQFLRGFGGELCPYRKIYKRNSKSLGIAQRIKG